MRYERGGCLRESCGIGKGASFPPVESKPRIQAAYPGSDVALNKRG